MPRRAPSAAPPSSTTIGCRVKGTGVNGSGTLTWAAAAVRTVTKRTAAIRIATVKSAPLVSVPSKVFDDRESAPLVADEDGNDVSKRPFDRGHAPVAKGCPQSRAAPRERDPFLVRRAGALHVKTRGLGQKLRRVALGRVGLGLRAEVG